MRTGSLPLLLAVTAALSTACSPTCGATCSRLYQEQQCDAKPPGITAEEAVVECTSACEAAMATPGIAPRDNDPKFDPDVPYAGSASSASILNNQNEAAAWMDCIWTFEDLAECREKLGSGGSRCALVLQ